MTIVTTYPGVYIQELQSLSLSVSPNATAIPAFAIDDNDARFTENTRISSWMDYTNKIGAFDKDNVLDVCMRIYFENGGGRCYLIPANQLIEEIPKQIDVTLIVSAGQDITSAVNQLCRNGNTLFAILDGPEDDLDNKPFTLAKHDSGQSRPSTETGAGAISTGNNPFAAVYYPWLEAPWSNVDIPPSAAMAGIYSMVDLTRGVWKAPANVTLRGGVLPKYPVTDDLQGRYTKGPNAINMIRVFETGGPTVWGARTREDSDQWRYISVRRLFNAAERDIKIAMNAAMFEPNNQPTWELTRAAITNYLHRLWQQGALAGAKESEAFFVQVGKDVTMTREEIDDGLMIVKVGMAAVRPAEFIILQFTQDMSH
ncbi:phage tail sheath family protein [Pseudoxanthomonas sp. UTMC 1351]|uniref:phage tail sheath family protein n=1 Tax=Pseudoxanthomonas sp. UTMC 1351 TaxID=2695853 RepID=UPI0034CF9C9E